jgi:hypothetical protein
MRELDRMRDQVRKTRNDEHERAEAWLAVCALAETIEKKPGDATLPGLWHRTIQATNAWRGSMKQ